MCSFISTACTNGLFGQDCSENCNGTCAGCNHVSGVCDSGCNPGRMGHSCNQSIVYTISLNVDKNQIHLHTLSMIFTSHKLYIRKKDITECFSRNKCLSTA